MEEETSAPPLQLHAQPDRIVARPARREFDFRHWVDVFGSFKRFRSHLAVQSLGVQFDEQTARLPRAEAGLTRFVAEDETPRPIEMEDRRFLRTGREAQLGSLGVPGFRGDGEGKRLFLPVLDPTLVVPIRTRQELEDIEPLDLRTTRENRLLPCLP